MKTYIVYANGYEVGMIKAGSTNAAEKKAIKKYEHLDAAIQVVYTEV